MYNLIGAPRTLAEIVGGKLRNKTQSPWVLHHNGWLFSTRFNLNQSYITAVVAKRIQG